MDTADEFIEKIEGYFDNFDDNFYSDYCHMCLEVYNYLKSSLKVKKLHDIAILIDKTVEEENKDMGLEVEDCIKYSLAFFKTLNERYENMALNLMNDTPIKKGDIVNSTARGIFLAGNYCDIPVLSHELTHRFVVGEIQMTNNNGFSDYSFIKYNLLGEVLAEVNTILISLLSCDFVRVNFLENIFKNEGFLYILSIAMELHSEWVLDYKTQIFEQIKTHKVRENLDEILSFLDVDLDPYINSEMWMARFIRDIGHTFGAMIACYIYQKIIEDPQNIKMMLGVEKALSTVDSTDTTLRFLEDLGLPFIKDGKISLNEENRKVILDAISKTINKCIDEDNNDHIKLFSHLPLVQDAYFSQVSQMFQNQEEEYLKKSI